MPVIRVLLCLSASFFLVNTVGCGPAPEAQQAAEEAEIPQDRMLPTPEQVAAEQEDAEPEAPVSEYLGVFEVKDDDGDVFNILILPDGKAITNWYKGETGARGEFGDWVVEDDHINLSYDSGWKDVILKNDEGYLKLGYAPGITLNDQPSNQGQAEKVTGPVAEYIGVWYREDTKAKAPWFLALLSDRTARRSDNIEAAGKWEIHDGGRVVITWEDEVVSTLQPKKDDNVLALAENTRQGAEGQVLYEGVLQKVTSQMGGPAASQEGTEVNPESLDDVSLEPGSNS